MIFRKRPMEDLKNALMLEAIKNNDVCKVRELLAESTDLTEFNRLISLLALVTDNYQIPVIKLLIYGNDVNLGEEIKCIFKLKDNINFKELVLYIIKQNKDADIKFYNKIFQELIVSNYKGPSSLEILRVLLKQGFAVDDFIDGLDITPLQFSVKHNRVDIVSKIFNFFYYNNFQKKSAKRCFRSDRT